MLLSIGWPHYWTEHEVEAAAGDSAGRASSDEALGNIKVDESQEGAT